MTLQQQQSLNEDLIKMSRWVYQWKMFFNPDTSKKSQEIVVTCKKCNYSWNYFLYQFANSQEEYTEILRYVSGYKIKLFGTCNWKNQESK